jgi:hypothetical protein
MWEGEGGVSGNGVDSPMAEEAVDKNGPPAAPSAAATAFADAPAEEASVSPSVHKSTEPQSDNLLGESDDLLGGSGVDLTGNGLNEAPAPLPVQKPAAVKKTIGIKFKK